MGYTLLVEPAELAALLGQSSVVVLDCRHDLADVASGRRAYADAHIPTARFVHLDEDLSAAKTGRNGRHPLPDRAAFAWRLGELGVSGASQVIAYDSSGGPYAARLWWMLRWLGHRDVAVLDGGWQAWVAGGHPVTSDVPTVTAATFPVRGSDEPVDANAILAALGSPGMLVIDARSPDRYRGENETLDPVGGRIPGAVNRFYRDNLASDGTFLPPAELRSAFAATLGGRPAGSVVHQCGSGVTACHNLFAMEVAGLGSSRLYPGSWSEWCSDPNRPVATGAP